MKIEWAEPALADLQGIQDYIARDSEYYANRFVEKVIHAIEKLEKFPRAGRRVPEAEEENIRELIFQGYRIIYQAQTERILILTVIHGAQDLGRKSPKPWDIV